LAADESPDNNEVVIKYCAASVISIVSDPIADDEVTLRPVYTIPNNSILSGKLITGLIGRIPLDGTALAADESPDNNEVVIKYCAASVISSPSMQGSPGLIGRIPLDGQLTDPFRFSIPVLLNPVVFDCP
jgi:hypothetical protein